MHRDDILEYTTTDSIEELAYKREQFKDEEKLPPAS